jgi:hypothetical protein
MEYRPKPQSLLLEGKGSKIQSLSPVKKEVWREVKVLLHP